MDWNKGVQKIDKELGHEQMERLIHQGSDKCDYGNHLGAFIKFFKPLGILFPLIEQINKERFIENNFSP